MHPNARHILLIHGAGGGGWEWALWRGVLQARGHACHAPDLQPAAGGLAATTLADYLGQVQAALLAMPAPRVVIGASLGGLLAAMLAGAKDNAVDSLVLVNALPPAPWHAGLPTRDWPDVVAWHARARLASTRAAMPDADAASALAAYRQWRDESGAVLRQAHAGIAVPRPDARTLAVIGGRDEDVPASVQLEHARAWDADITLQQEAGHLCPLLGRRAAGCANQVADWLSRR